MSGDLLSLWEHLTDNNRQKAAAYARKLLDKQQATVTVGVRETEYNTVREALEDLDSLLVPGMDLTIADHTGAVLHVFRWHTQEEAAAAVSASPLHIFYADDSSSLWAEEERAEE